MRYLFMNWCSAVKMRTRITCFRLSDQVIRTEIERLSIYFKVSNGVPKHFQCKDREKSVRFFISQRFKRESMFKID